MREEFHPQKISEVESYVTIKICTECHQGLKDDEIYKSDGVCPLCKHDSEREILDHELAVYKKTQTSPILPKWNFWSTPTFKYEKIA